MHLFHQIRPSARSSERGHWEWNKPISQTDPQPGALRRGDIWKQKSAWSGQSNSEVFETLRDHRLPCFWAHLPLQPVASFCRMSAGVFLGQVGRAKPLSDAIRLSDITETLRWKRVFNFWWRVSEEGSRNERENRMPQPWRELCFGCADVRGASFEIAVRQMAMWNEEMLRMTCWPACVKEFSVCMKYTDDLLHLSKYAVGIRGTCVECLFPQCTAFSYFKCSKWTISSNNYDI